jgi:hypothetical protein
MHDYCLGLLMPIERKSVEPVPMSLIGTFAVLYALGYSLDNLSLMALTTMYALLAGIPLMLGTASARRSASRSAMPSLAACWCRSC